jgi:hypothetical protein
VRTPLHDTRDNLRSGRLRQRFELRELRFYRTLRIFGIYCDNDRKCRISQESPSL